MFFAWEVHSVFWALLHVNLLISVSDSTEALPYYTRVIKFLLWRFKKINKNTTKLNLLGSCQPSLICTFCTFPSISIISPNSIWQEQQVCITPLNSEEIHNQRGLLNRLGTMRANVFV